ncbi:DUF305 domain-containing protein [Planomonospora venezuelensis]|uniref:Uncharacterized protein (DUF305 family) n=1 Tax=Planomonospora venezuelensis TaxID=1999 RepID=A0A841D2H8_PLAVE|nr:DUF305 domain-containing protein [Planomonospora venezuelensis]MBB5963689.1 uncharacterized protein (DUF305 family) [Planomonospora venezuelensis]
MKRFAAVLAAAGLLALPACGTAESTYGAGTAPTAGTAQAAATGDADARDVDTGDADARDVDTGDADARDVDTGDVNAADVVFLQMMVAHNRQGMEMAGLVTDRSARQGVKELAAQAGAVQRDEVAAMTRWLYDWDQPLAGSGHAHGDHAALHTTSPEEITTLRRMSGAGFDTRFLNVFIAHQHNAVEMARAEIRTGRHPGVKRLARMIDRSRSAQIREMLGHLAS